MTLAEQLVKVRFILDEMDVDNSHWSDGRLTAFLNEGQDDAAMRLPATLVPDLLTIAYGDLAFSTNTYSFDEEFVSLDYVLLTFDNAARDCKRMARVRPLDWYNTMSDNSGETPSSTHPVVLTYGRIIKVFPTPTQTVEDGIEYYYRRPPVEMVQDDDKPEIAKQVHFLLVCYAVYRALFEDGDERAGAEWQKYIGYFKGEK